MTAPIESVAGFVVLGIDQSTSSSGWALIGEPVGSRRAGIAKNAEQIREVMHEAKSFAGPLPIVAVLEDHRSFAFSRGNMSVKSLLGMGAARGRWQQELEAAGITDVHMVEPRVWRKAVLGLSGNASAERAKEAAIAHASLLLRRVASSDEAEALCIALWGTCNLWPKPVKRRRAKHG